MIYYASILLSNGIKLNHYVYQIKMYLREYIYIYILNIKDYNDKNSY